MEITDIKGGGKRTVCVYSWVGNEDYISLGQAQVDFLRTYLNDTLGEYAADYTLKYEGLKGNTTDGIPTDTQVNELFELTDSEKAMGYNCISMTYSFEDIDDYNLKTERLYSLSANLAITGEDENYGRCELEDYSPATINVKETDEQNYYRVVFSEKGQTSVGLTAWAITALWQERDNTELWHNGDVAYEPLTDDESKTVYAAQKTTVNITVGDKSKRIRTVSQTPVMGQATLVGVDYTVSGRIYSQTLPNELKNEVSLWDRWAWVVIAVIGVAVICLGGYAIIRGINKRKKTA